MLTLQLMGSIGIAALMIAAAFAVTRTRMQCKVVRIGIIAAACCAPIGLWAPLGSRYIAPFVPDNNEITLMLDAVAIAIPDDYRETQLIKSDDTLPAWRTRSPIGHQTYLVPAPINEDALPSFQTATHVMRTYDPRSGSACFTAAIAAPNTRSAAVHNALIAPAYGRTPRSHSPVEILGGTCFRISSHDTSLHAWRLSNDELLTTTRDFLDDTLASLARTQLAGWGWRSAACTYQEAFDPDSGFCGATMTAWEETEADAAYDAEALTLFGITDADIDTRARYASQVAGTAKAMWAKDITRPWYSTTTMFGVLLTLIMWTSFYRNAYGTRQRRMRTSWHAYFSGIDEHTFTRNETRSAERAAAHHALAQRASNVGLPNHVTQALLRENALPLLRTRIAEAEVHAEQTTIAQAKRNATIARASELHIAPAVRAALDAGNEARAHALIEEREEEERRCKYLDLLAERIQQLPAQDITRATHLHRTASHVRSARARTYRKALYPLEQMLREHDLLEQAA